MFDTLFAPQYPERRQVVVNTKTSEAYRGLLWEKNREYLMLKSAELLSEGGRAVKMDGDLIVFRENVDTLQVLH